MIPHKKIIVSDNLRKSIQQIQYDLVLASPQLENQTLSKMIYHDGIENDQLFIPTEGGFDVKAPNYYIQKIRAIYYLLLVCVFEEPKKLQNLRASIQNLTQSRDSNDIFNSQILVTRYGTSEGIQNIKNGFALLKLNLYTDKSTPKINKKYFAEFNQLLTYTSESSSNKISKTINKYPIIDEILIDTFLKLIGSETLDDNLNIQNCLKSKLGINCTFQMFREFKVEGISIKVIQDGFRIVQNKGVIQQIEKYIETANKKEGNAWELLDVSRVDEFQTDVFKKMEKSYIQELDEFSEPDPSKKQIHLQDFLKKGISNISTTRTISESSQQNCEPFQDQNQIFQKNQAVTNIKQPSTPLRTFKEENFFKITPSNDKNSTNKAVETPQKQTVEVRKYPSPYNRELQIPLNSASRNVIRVQSYNSASQRSQVNQNLTPRYQIYERGRALHYDEIQKKYLVRQTKQEGKKEEIKKSTLSSLRPPEILKLDANRNVTNFSSKPIHMNPEIFTPTMTSTGIISPRKYSYFFDKSANRYKISSPDIIKKDIAQTYQNSNFKPSTASREESRVNYTSRKVQNI